MSGALAAAGDMDKWHAATPRLKVVDAAPADVEMSDAEIIELPPVRPEPIEWRDVIFAW